ALRLVDRHVGLGLAVAVHLDDLVLAEDAALLVDVVDDHLGPAPAVERAGGRERARVIVEGADLDGLPLGGRGRRGPEEQRGRAQRDQGRKNARRPHGLPPDVVPFVSAPPGAGARKVANRITRAAVGQRSGTVRARAGPAPATRAPLAPLASGAGDPPRA